MKVIFLATGFFLIGGLAWSSIEPQSLSLPPPPTYSLGPSPEELGSNPIRNDSDSSQSSSQKIVKAPVELAPSSIISAGGAYPLPDGFLGPQAQSSMGLGVSIPLELGDGFGPFKRGLPEGEPGIAGAGEFGQGRGHVK